MLTLYLFGETRLFDPSGDRLRLATRKVEHLLAYLWIYRSQPQPRETLAGFLWPDADEESARTSLLSALHNLRKVVEPFEGSLPLEKEREADLKLELATAHHCTKNLETAYSLAEEAQRLYEYVQMPIKRAHA